eukprot:GHVT01025635.1.p1 GENE.GHVT01025635.1~~GHVT01025635.1.p1  ORF type:complete len:527 (-),score=115.88 GHVT01025635.1:599-2179(-)
MNGSKCRFAHGVEQLPAVDEVKETEALARVVPPRSRQKRQNDMRQQETDSDYDAEGRDVPATGLGLPVPPPPPPPPAPRHMRMPFAHGVLVDRSGIPPPPPPPAADASIAPFQRAQPTALPEPSLSSPLRLPFPRRGSQQHLSARGTPPQGLSPPDRAVRRSPFPVPPPPPPLDEVAEKATPAKPHSQPRAAHDETPRTCAPLSTAFSSAASSAITSPLCLPVAADRSSAMRGAGHSLSPHAAGSMLPFSAPFPLPPAASPLPEKRVTVHPPRTPRETTTATLACLPRVTPSNSISLIEDCATTTQQNLHLSNAAYYYCTTAGSCAATPAAAYLPYMTPSNAAYTPGEQVTPCNREHASAAASIPEWDNISKDIMSVGDSISAYSSHLSYPACEKATDVSATDIMPCSPCAKPFAGPYNAAATEFPSSPCAKAAPVPFCGADALPLVQVLVEVAPGQYQIALLPAASTVPTANSVAIAQPAPARLTAAFPSVVPSPILSKIESFRNCAGVSLAHDLAAALPAAYED